jgi:hypothetical protein
MQKTGMFEQLLWKDGVGRVPEIVPICFNGTHFESYEREAQTSIGKGIMRFRIKTVKQLVSYRRISTHCLDVGIRSGHFLRELKRTSDIQGQGIDVNNWSIQWLHANGFVCTRDKFEILTFWNTLDHLTEPWLLWRNYKPLFIAMTQTIFKNKEQIERHQHFKPQQHYWYFTRLGLLEFMERHGYGLVNSCNTEDVKWGQDNKMTFTFMRK